VLHRWCYTVLVLSLAAEAPVAKPGRRVVNLNGVGVLDLMGLGDS
jgi:hypothetical protein